MSPRDFERVLWRHVLDPWFPRCLDREHGGFLSGFDLDWNPCGDHHKLLEFQARQTLCAAEAARRYPAVTHLREAALHGFRCLADCMWDARHGGWYHRTDRLGNPLEGATKHTHGFAYAIVACIAVHTLTGEREPLDLALEAADWLDRHAYDPVNGGYFGLMTQEGAVIRAPDPAIWNSTRDSLGNPLGIKDANVHTDMLEPLAALAGTGECDHALPRLTELTNLLVTRLLQANGALPYLFHADWTPMQPEERTGYLLQGAHRLQRLGRSGTSSAACEDAALRMVARAVQVYWVSFRGGFREIGSIHETERTAGTAPLVKNWWVQWEGLRALFDCYAAGKRPEYLSYLRAQWRYLDRFILDHRRGGTFRHGLDKFGVWQRRVRPSGIVPPHPGKGEVWKDASHEARALLHCIERST
ncbi:MAG: AGE family epimerase/isomerase [Alphaproteobacteria bacterium]